jgi:hypothetical protein
MKGFDLKNEGMVDGTMVVNSKLSFPELEHLDQILIKVFHSILITICISSLTTTSYLSLLTSASCTI